MFNFQAKIRLLSLLALLVVFGLPGVMALAADGDDFSTSADYYLNQRRIGGTEMRATSDDYELIGMFGEPGVGEANSDDYSFNSGTIWRTPGTLAIEIVDENYVTVGSPSVAMSNATFSFTSQTTTGELGSNTQRVYWENFDAADTAGYTITMAATGGATDLWEGAGASDFDYNDEDGAVDGGDADAFGGQLTVDPDNGSITARSGYGTTTGISLGGIATYEEGVVDSITLVSATGGSDDYHAAYATGMDLSQELPASLPADTYTINMTLTIA